jgi:hypothetical protein
LAGLLFDAGVVCNACWFDFTVDCQPGDVFDPQTWRAAGVGQLFLPGLLPVFAII